MEKKKIIITFAPKHHQFLSYFYDKAPLFDKNGISFKSVYQAFIAEMTDDIAIKRQISLLKTSAEIRIFELSLLKPLHTPQWRLKKMFDLNVRKFVEYPALRKKLKNTLPYILENNLFYEELFWGKYKGEGLNNHGIILMDIRACIT